MRDHELPGVPVINEGGRCVGIITEADLVIMPTRSEDLHLPHYFELFGGFVFLESTKKFEERLRKAFAATAQDMMTADPITIEPDATSREAARADRAQQAQPAAGGRARPPGRRGHPHRRARRADAPTRTERGPGAGPRRHRRDRAQLRPAGRARAALCAVVKADGYGHGAVAAARAAQRGGAAWLAVATAGEAAELRAAGIDGPLLVMGALSAAELDVALAARADVVAWREEFVAALAAPTRACTSSSTPAWAGSARAIRTRRRASPTPSRPRRAAARGRDDPLRHRRRRPGVHARAARRFPAVGRDGSSAPPTAPRRQLRRDAARSPAARLDMVRCGIAIYGMDPFHRDPADHGLEPALELVSYVAEVKRARRGRARATGAGSSPSATPGSARSRSATATACGAG